MAVDARRPLTGYDMVRLVACVLAFGWISGWAGGPTAATAWARIHEVVSLGECSAQDGAVIEDCKMGYTQFGKATADGDNVIVVPSWLSARSTAMMEFFAGLAQQLESGGYCVIVVDMFGNGVSSSPSNSPLQPGYHFPHFTVGDAVKAQHTLLTEYLHIGHVRAVMGLSMGGLQTLQWAVQYPDYMDKVVDVVGTPRPTSGDKDLWRSQVHLIEATHVTDKSVTLDLRAQLLAMLEHDILPGGSYEDMAAGIHAKLFTIAAKYDKMVNPEPSIALARAKDAQLWITHSWCGHFAPAVCQAQQTRDVIEAFVLADN